MGSCTRTETAAACDARTLAETDYCALQEPELCGSAHTHTNYFYREISTENHKYVVIARLRVSEERYPAPHSYLEDVITK